MRKLTESERIHALHLFYLESKSIKDISVILNCSLWDLSPWITSLATRIVLGETNGNSRTLPIANLLITMQDAANAHLVMGHADTAKILTDAAVSLRILAVNHETDQNFLHIMDVNYREVLDILTAIVNARVYERLGEPESGISLELVAAIMNAAAMLKNKEPTDTEDRYTQAFASDGVVFLKDGEPLTIDTVLDILNGRTRR